MLLSFGWLDGIGLVEVGDEQVEPTVVLDGDFNIGGRVLVEPLLSCGVSAMRACFSHMTVIEMHVLLLLEHLYAS